MYADNITSSMQKAMDETSRRRQLQQKFNEEHGITPQTIKKDIRDILQSVKPVEQKEENAAEEFDYEKLLAELTADMFKAAENLEFERAAELRDKIKRIEKEYLE